MINLPDAAGYVFAISYQNDLSKVTLENLVIFSVRYKCAFPPPSQFLTDESGPALPSAE